MKTYKIVSGEWQNEEKTNAVLSVEEIEDGKTSAQYNYGFDADDKAPVNLRLKELLEENDSMVERNVYIRRLKGELPLLQGTAIVNGKIVDIGLERAGVRLRIKKRIDELYSGYEQALAERDPVYAENRRRKIDNLLAAEEDPDIYADLQEVEDA